MTSIFSQRIVFGLATLLLLLSGCTTVSIPGTVKVPSNKGVAPDTIVIQNFAGPGRLGLEMRNAIVSRIRDEGFVKVTNHSTHAQMTGQISISRLMQNQWNEKGEYKGKVFYTYYFKIEKTMTVTYQAVVNGEIAGDTYTRTYSRTFSGDSYNKARSQAPSEAAIHSELMGEIADLIARDVTPHQVTRKFRFHKGDDDNISTGIKYVKHQRYDQALSIFRQVADNTPDVEDRAAAFYNMGLVHEMQGDFHAAFEKYRDANQMVLGEDDYIEALTRAERLYEDQQELRRQTGQ